MCDYSEPGVAQGDTHAWQTYQRADGAVIYGGESLGPRPAGSGSGLLGPSFLSLLDE